MSFQKEVNRYPAVGVPGQVGTLNPATYFPRMALADENGVNVGQGVFFNPTDELATKSGASPNLFAGIAVRNLDHAYYDVLSGGSMELVEGQAVSILSKGDIFIEAESAAVFGDNVYCSTTDGSLSFDDATTPPSGTVPTGFKVVTAGDSGETILISSYGLYTQTTAAASA